MLQMNCLKYWHGVRFIAKEFFDNDAKNKESLVDDW
jgi:hypothetical protein